MTVSENKLAADCDRYLAARTATFEQRCQRYQSALEVMQSHGGLTDDDILLDFGAGGTDLDAFLRRPPHLWRGRYWPVDGWMGTDLKWWAPKRPVSWLVGLEIIEHLDKSIALEVIEEMKYWVTKGVVLSTPNADTVDVLAMDETHKWGAVMDDLLSCGYTATTASLYGSPGDSVVAWWTAPSGDVHG